MVEGTMETLAEPKIGSSEAATAAEDALFEAFADLLETLPPEKRAGLIGDLRANAEAFE